MSRASHRQPSGHVPRNALKRPAHAIRASQTGARPRKRFKESSSAFSVSSSPEPAPGSPAREREDYAATTRGKQEHVRSQADSERVPTLDKYRGGDDSVIQYADVLLQAAEQVAAQGQPTANRQTTAADRGLTGKEQALEQRVAVVQESTMPRGTQEQPSMDRQSGVIELKMPLSVRDLLCTSSPLKLPSVAKTEQAAPTDIISRRRGVAEPPAVEERVAELRSTNEPHSNINPGSEMGHSSGPKHQPLAVQHSIATRLSVSRQQARANIETVNQRAADQLVPEQQTTMQQITSEHADMPDGEEVVASDAYTISYADNPMPLRGYVIQRSPSAPYYFPEWKDAQRLDALDDGIDVYEPGDIVHIDLELEEQHSKACPASLARIVEMRDLGCADRDKDSRIVFLVAWFSTLHDMRRYRDDWGCKNTSAWPKGKTYILTTRLQLVEAGAVGHVLSLERGKRLAMDKVHDVLGSGRITRKESVEWRFREAVSRQA